MLNKKPAHDRLACGYVLLEEPCDKKGVRYSKFSDEKPKHAFSETIFTCVSMKPTLSSRAFFQGKVHSHYTAYI